MKTFVTDKQTDIETSGEGKKSLWIIKIVPYQSGHL